MTSLPPVRGFARASLGLLVAATVGASVRAQPSAAPATKGSTGTRGHHGHAHAGGTADHRLGVDVITAADLARRQATSLAAALGGAAGAPHFASGAGGAMTSLFLRGANSNQTLFLVDGLRLNDPNTDYAGFPRRRVRGRCDSLEIGHGPQSTLYGGEAVGGVVSLRAQRGAGAPTARVALEAGSFGTVQGAVSAQGERGANAWSFSAQGGHTDNDRENNYFDSTTRALRLDRKVTHASRSAARCGGFTASTAIRAIATPTIPTTWSARKTCSRRPLRT
jgi:outer membrane cobalamin receptor